MSNNNYKEFPADFNGKNLKNKMNNITAHTLAKYRKMLYDEFTRTELNYFEVKIDDDFDSIQCYIRNELVKPSSG